MPQAVLTTEQTANLAMPKAVAPSVPVSGQAQQAPVPSQPVTGVAA